MYSYSQPGAAWSSLYGGVANPAIAAGPTPAQYGNNLQQYYNANMGVLQPSLAALIQQQYKNLGHGRSPLVNQAANLQMMQMAYNPAASSASSAEQYARGLLSNAANVAMQYPRQDNAYGGYSSYDGGRSTYDHPMGGEYRNSGGFAPSSSAVQQSQSSGGGSGYYRALQDYSKPGGSSPSGGSPTVSGATGGSTVSSGLWNNGVYTGGATPGYAPNQQSPGYTDLMPGGYPGSSNQYSGMGLG